MTGGWQSRLWLSRGGSVLCLLSHLAVQGRTAGERPTAAQTLTLAAHRTHRLSMVMLTQACLPSLRSTDVRFVSPTGTSQSWNGSVFPPVANSVPAAAAFFPLTDGEGSAVQAWPDAVYSGLLNSSSMYVAPLSRR